MDHAQNLLARIHAQKLRPVPRWRVRLRKAGIALLFSAVVLSGTFSVALVFQALHSHGGRGWMLRQALNQAAPYVWTLTFGLLVAAGIRVFRELPRGWRVRPYQVGLGLALVCLAGGWIVERSDALMQLHRAVAQRVPQYRSAWQSQALARWHAPTEGRLGGNWDANKAAGGFVAVDGVRWIVQWESPDALPVADGGPIRLLGRVCGPGRFCADQWRPAPGQGKFFHEP